MARLGLGFGLGRGLVAAAAVCALAVFSPQRAAADSLYVGQSPSLTQCDNEEWSILPADQMRIRGQSVGTAYLRYSPACGTDWVTVYFDSSKFFMMPYVWMQNTSGTSQGTDDDSPFLGETYTLMTEGRNNADCGGVQVYRANALGGIDLQGWLGWVYLGCAAPNPAERGAPASPIPVLGTAPLPAPVPTPTPAPAPTPAPNPAPSTPETFAETPGGEVHTWTDYGDAGGIEGPTIPSNQTIAVSCKTSGFAVADGDTWWYRIASAPWSGSFYGSADAFYNNGQTSGSLIGTPYVDPAVPNC